MPEQHKALSADSEETQRSALTLTISAAIEQLYARFYGHDRTTATTYQRRRRGLRAPAHSKATPPPACELFFLEAASGAANGAPS